MVGGNHELLDGKRQMQFPQDFHLGERKRRSRCRDHVTFQRMVLQRRLVCLTPSQNSLSMPEMSRVSHPFPKGCSLLPPHGITASRPPSAEQCWQDCLVFSCLFPSPCLTHLPEPHGLSLLGVWKSQHFLPILLPALLCFGERFSGILRLQHDTAQAHARPPKIYRRKV